MIHREPILQVNFCVTNRCNLNCRDCCCDVPRIHDKWDAKESYILAAAQFMRGKIEWIQITGGEPLMNPRIDSIIPMMRGAFEVRMLTMETNGFLVLEHAKAMDSLDEFYVTQYDSFTFQNSTDTGTNNMDIIGRLKDRFGDKCKIVHPIHIPRTRRSGGGVCGRGKSGVVAYWMGHVYPCCVGPGIQDCPRITLSKDWKDKITSVDPPCNNCWFSEAA